MNNLSKSEDLPILSILCLAVALLPLAFLTSAFDVFGAVKYTLLVLLALLSFGTQLWLAAATGRVRFPGGRIGLALCLFLAWLILSTAFSPMAAVSFFGLRRRLLGLTTYLASALLLAAASRVSWDEDKIRAIFYSICAAITVSSSIGVAQHFFGSPYPFDLRDIFNRSAYSTFGNPNFFGLFLVLVLPIPLYLALDGKPLKDRIIGYVGLSATVIGLVTAASSGSVVGATGAGGAWLILRYVRGHVQPNFLKIAAAALVVIILLGSAYAVTQETTAIGQRTWIWQAGLRVALSRPILGTGLDNLKSGLQQLDIKPEPNSSGGQYEDAHNNWLNLAATAGWPSLLFFLGFLTLITSSAIKAGGRGKFGGRILSVPLAGGLGYLIAAQFNPEELSSMPIFWIFLGMIISLVGEVKSLKLKAGPPVYVASGMLSLVLLTGAFFAGNTLTAEINLLKADKATDLAAAEAAFKAVQKIQPWQSQYYVMEVYRLLPSVGDLKTPAGREIIRAAQKAVAVDDNNPDNWIAMGEIYRSIAQRQGSRELHRTALDLFKRAITIDKYNDRAILLTALTYKDLNDPKNSLRWIKTYERSFSPDTELTNLKNQLLNSGSDKSPDKT